MSADPYEKLTPMQRAILNEVQSIAFETGDDVGAILARLPEHREDLKAVSDALAAARR